MEPRASLEIRPATAADTPLLLAFIRELADYERLADEVVATEEGLRTELFGPQPVAEAVIAEGAVIAPSAHGAEGAVIAPSAHGAERTGDGGVAEPLGFALFFHNFSTFLGRRGLYLEDLYVRPAARGQGVGRALLQHLAGLALARGCGRLEWSVLDWNAPAIRFYGSLGAVAMDEWTTFRLTGEALRALAGGGAGDRHEQA